jgi:DNA-binding response OmpR family regulator
VSARVHALVGDGESEILEFKDLTINLKTYEAKAGEVLLDLTFMEYELLKFFVENQENVWSREDLLEKVWGYDYFGGARTVDVHVRRLRAKLGDVRNDWIKTVHSVGYKFN